MTPSTDIPASATWPTTRSVSSSNSTYTNDAPKSETPRTVLTRGAPTSADDDRRRDLGVDQIGTAVPVRIDDDLGVAEVGKEVEGEVLQGLPPGEGGGGCEREDEEAMVG